MKIHTILFAILLSITGSTIISYEQPTAIAVTDYFNELVPLGVFCFGKGITLLDLQKSLVNNGYTSLLLDKMPQHFRSASSIRKWGFMYTISGMLCMIAPCILFWLENNKKFRNEQEKFKEDMNSRDGYIN